MRRELPQASPMANDDRTIGMFKLVRTTVGVCTAPARFRKATAEIVSPGSRWNGTEARTTTLSLSAESSPSTRIVFTDRQVPAGLDKEMTVRRSGLRPAGFRYVDANLAAGIGAAGYENFRSIDLDGFDDDPGTPGGLRGPFLCIG